MIEARLELVVAGTGLWILQLFGRKERVNLNQFLQGLRSGFWSALQSSAL